MLNTILKQYAESLPESEQALAFEKAEDYVSKLKKKGISDKKIAEDYNAIFIPAQSIFDDACKLAPKNYWLGDGVHPTSAGHKLLTDAWIKATESIR